MSPIGAKPLFLIFCIPSEHPYKYEGYPIQDCVIPSIKYNYHVTAELGGLVTVHLQAMWTGATALLHGTHRI